MKKPKMSLYWDTQDPRNEGWAWRIEGGASGPVDGDLPSDASLEDVLAAAGSDVPEALQDAEWMPLPGLGWVAHEGGGT